MYKNLKRHSFETNEVYKIGVTTILVLECVMSSHNSPSIY